MPIRAERGAEPIEGYKLIERLGGGGFGEVWKAEAPGGFLKAIKIVHGDLNHASTDDFQRAEQELKALRRVKSVRHPYILSLERFDVIEGRLLIVMELADQNLWDRFRECKNQGLPGFPREELLRYMEESAEALDLMNMQYQLQHLDIKPQNLFLVSNHIKIADFGLVKDLQGMAASVTGGVTPVYAAPETFDGVVSRYCDQYSLAIVYQELLTGQRPFVCTNVHQVIMQHVQGTPDLSPLPANDRPAIARALAKHPDERHPSCTDMVRALRSGTVTEIVTDGLSALPSSASSPSLPSTKPEELFKVSSSAILPPPETPRVPGRVQERVAATNIKPLPQNASAIKIEEETGSGELFPALAVGLGHLGRITLKHLSKECESRFGALEAVPHIRLLSIDTDPQTHDRIIPNDSNLASGGVETILARLNRARYYLTPRQGKLRIDSWFDTNMLYRIQRTQVTGGIRALGRLAFFGNYHTIAARLTAALEACTDNAALEEAMKKTGLGLRTNQPRVFVISSLAGGSGSGMFIDAAYVIRKILIGMGYRNPEVVAILLVPEVDSKVSSPLVLGNTFAALTELHHFSVPGSAFTARYDDREPALNFCEPPFNCSILLPLSAESGAFEEQAALASQYLYENLFTQLGRSVDKRPITATTLRGPDQQAEVKTFGLFKITWPRREFLQSASRRFCRRLIQRWLSKDTKPFQETSRTLVRAQWQEMELAPEYLIKRLQLSCEAALGQLPESAFGAVVEPLVGDNRKSTEVGQMAFEQGLAKLEELVGRPSQSSVLHRPGTLEEPLCRESETAVGECQQQLIRFTTALAEQPEFRLAGAEAAVRQAVNLIEETLKSHEQLCQELTEKADKGYDRLHFLLGSFQEIAKGGRKGGNLAAELVELIRLYPKWRYQSLVLQRVIYCYTSLRGFLSDQVREIGFYRIRLVELLHSFEGSGGPEKTEVNRLQILPQGCSTLAEAVEQLFPEVVDSDLDGLDRRIQLLIRQHFTSLAHVCLASSNLLKNLHPAMIAVAEELVKSRLAGTNVVDAFEARYPNFADASDCLSNAFDNAGPELQNPGESSGDEVAFVSVPPSSEHERFCRTIASSLPQANIVKSRSGDDIVVYREWTGMDMAGIPQLGPSCAAIYEQMTAADHFTPHCRIDITNWQVPTSLPGTNDRKM